MKKLLFIMFALILCMGMTSCKDKGVAKNEKGGTEIATNISALTERVEKEGANWSIDEWLMLFKDYDNIMRPVINESKALKKKYDQSQSTEEKAKIEKEIDEVNRKYEGLCVEKENNRFINAVKATEKGREALKMYQKQLGEELNINNQAK